MKTGTNFTEAKAERDRIESDVRVAATALSAISGGGAMGLTPDSVKASPQWRKAKAAYVTAHRELQDFNQEFTRAFAKELRAERRSRWAEGDSAPER